MSTINTTINVRNQSTGIMFPVNQSRVTDQDGFSVSQITVVATEEPVSIEYASPRQVTLRLLSGDDVKVGVHLGASGGIYPLRLSGVNEAMVLRLDVEGLREISTVVCGADTASSLSGNYFDLTDRSNYAVRVWYNMAATAAFGSVTYGSPADTNTLVVNGTTFTKVASAPTSVQFTTIEELTALIDGEALISATDDGTTISIVADTAGTAGNAITLAKTGSALTLSAATLTGGTATSTAPATPSSGRLLPVVIAEGDTAATVATATQLAVDADTEFTATVLSATVTITDAHTGTRTDVSSGTTGWSVSTTQQGAASPTVYLKSVGTSQVVVAVAPN